MFGWLKKEGKTNKELAIEKFKKIGLTFEEADYLAQDIAELSLHAEKKLFSKEDNSVHSLEDAYKDKYFMSTVNSMIEDNKPDLIRDLAYTGMQARANGLNFEIIVAIRKSVFDYIERTELDNSHFREVFMQTLDTVNLEKKGSSLMELLYSKGWIEDVNNQQYIDSINTMLDTFGEDQALKNIHAMIEECQLWYKQVNNPVSPLQKLTNLSLDWLGGELEEVKNNILLHQTSPFDLLLNTFGLKEEIKKALKDAEENWDFPQMDDGYRDDVSSRFIQYMQEELRLDIINRRNSEYIEER